MGRRVRCRAIGIGFVMGLAVAGGTALAEPTIRPPVADAGEPQSFTFVIPDEHVPNATLTRVELYPPPELRIQSFSDTDGWKLDWTIVSLDVTVQKATWTRISEADEDPFYAQSGDEKHADPAKGVRFRFVAVPAARTSYPVEVRETFSTGDTIHWTGPTSHAFPPSPPGTESRPPIVLQSSGASGRPYGWIAAAAAGVVAIAAAVGVAARRRERERS